MRLEGCHGDLSAQRVAVAMVGMVGCHSRSSWQVVIVGCRSYSCCGRSPCQPRQAGHSHAPTVLPFPRQKIAAAFSLTKSVLFGPEIERFGAQILSRER